MAEIYLAGGCFWGVERYFQLLKGIVDTDVGYANSKVINPTYELVCTGKTFSVECVKVVFNEEEITLEKLLTHFFCLIDPTVLNRQGADIGTQYRTGIYYTNEYSLFKDKVEAFRNEFQKGLKEEIVTEILPLENFYLGEEYHQNYLIKNPNGYCHCNSEIEKLKKSGDSGASVL